MPPNLLDDYLDLKPFAKEVDRHPRTVRRWLDQPDGLPYTRIGNRILIHTSDRARMDFWADAQTRAAQSAPSPKHASRRSRLKRTGGD